MSEAKVALVTGSSSGIGEATVLLLASKGYQIAVVGSNKEKVDRVIAKCIEVSPQKFQPLALVLDFSDPDNGGLAVKKTIEHFGRLDVLVNNAGMYAKTLVDEPEAYDAGRKVMAINYDSAVKATLAAIGHLREAKGNLIFVSSIASMKAVERSFGYCASKAAMTSFAKCMAIDLAPAVRVNVISPGPTITSIFKHVNLPKEIIAQMMNHTTLRETVAEADEIAKTIAFLISDDASYIHGHDLVVDGGYLLKPSRHTVAQTIISAKNE